MGFFALSPPLGLFLPPRPSRGAAGALGIPPRPPSRARAVLTCSRGAAAAPSPRRGRRSAVRAGPGCAVPGCAVPYRAVLCPTGPGRAAGPPAERRGGEPSPHLSAGATPARRVLIPHFPASGRRRGKTKKGPGYKFPVNSSPCGLVSSLGRLPRGGWC